MVKNEGTNKEAGKIYEIGYLLLPSITEENVGLESAKIHELVKKHGGTIISDENPKLRELAYAMEKVVANKKSIFTSAYFGWVKFEMESAEIAGLEKEMNKDTNIIRFLLISTVRENTIASRRPSGRLADDKRSDLKDGKMSDEEIEKTVAELVK